RRCRAARRRRRPLTARGGSRGEEGYPRSCRSLAGGAVVHLETHAGSVNWTARPAAGRRSAHSRPPCASTIDRLIASPIPSPSAFVVENGVNISRRAPPPIRGPPASPPRITRSPRPHIRTPPPPPRRCAPVPPPPPAPPPPPPPPAPPPPPPLPPAAPRTAAPPPARSPAPPRASPRRPAAPSPPAAAAADPAAARSDPRPAS